MIPSYQLEQWGWWWYNRDPGRGGFGVRMLSLPQGKLNTLKLSTFGTFRCNCPVRGKSEIWIYICDAGWGWRKRSLLKRQEGFGVPVVTKMDGSGILEDQEEKKRADVTDTSVSQNYNTIFILVSLVNNFLEHSNVLYLYTICFTNIWGSLW